MTSKETVNNFISKFYGDTTDVFSNGCCYWFANILYKRFAYKEIDEKVTIVYDQVANHFGTKIGEHVYDITGDVTDKYDWESWMDIDDPLLKDRIIRDCIML